jgi:hypothetical protein
LVATVVLVLHRLSAAQLPHMLAAAVAVQMVVPLVEVLAVLEEAVMDVLVVMH